MIKTLQKKFIFTAMAAVTILLAVLIGGINGAYGWFLDRQAGRQLEMLAETEGRIQRREKPRLQPRSFLEPPMDEDAAMSLRFFVVRFDENGNIVHKDISRIASVSAKEAEAYAAQVSEEGKQAGYIDGFKYRAAASVHSDKAAGGGKTIVFLDVSGQFRMMMLVFVLTTGIAVFCWAGMLLLVIVLSRRAIRPIARNFQKQKQFVTDAGHEIKTPLAIIQANVDAMELINGENKWSRNIRDQAVRLNGLMQNLLTLAKMEEEHLKLSMEEIGFSALLEESIQPFYELAAARGVRIETKIQQNVRIYADRESIQRLLSILFDNAVKYADADGRIAIALRQSDAEAFLRVENTCEKLPADDAGRLFDRFYRGDSARTQKNGGYGIGLSAAYAIAAAHKGRITAEYIDAHTIAFLVEIG